MRPPTLSRASSIVTLMPASARRRAAARPATPAPMISTDCMRTCSGRLLNDHASHTLKFGTGGFNEDSEIEGANSLSSAACLVLPLLRSNCALRHENHLSRESLSSGLLRQTSPRAGQEQKLILEVRLRIDLYVDSFDPQTRSAATRTGSGTTDDPRAG